MSAQKKLIQRTKRRTFRVRNRLQNPSKRLRVSVFRSLKHIHAQIIDDVQHKTVLSFSSHQVSEKGGEKSAVAKIVGIELGKKAREQSIDRVFFDRGHYRYHGRVKALADGLRESGLVF